MAVSEPLEETTPRWARWWLALVTLSAFGPYLAAGVRTEQIAVYGSVVLMGLGMWLPIYWCGTRAPVPFLFLWGGYAAIVIIGALLPVHNLTGFPTGSTPPGIDNALIPLAMLLITWAWVSISPSFDLLRLAAKVVVVTMMINGLLAAATVTGPGLSKFSWLSNFWGGEAGTTPVAENAATNGRFSGIFNQPVEAGIAYSLAIFCLLYLVAVATKPRTWFIAPVGAMLTIGGLLTTSKVFLLGGLPITVYLVLRERKRRATLLLLTVSIPLALAFLDWLGLELALPEWRGTQMFANLAATAGDAPVTAVTAGRFGEGGSLAGIASEVIEHHTFFGLGAGGLAVPYDSAWLEALVVGGVVGVTLVMAVHVILVVRWWHLRDVLPAPEWRLAGAVTALTLGASLGMPTLSGNRVATLLWVFLGMLVVARQPAISDKPVGRSSCRHLRDPARGGQMGSLRI